MQLVHEYAPRVAYRAPRARLPRIPAAWSGTADCLTLIEYRYTINAILIRSVRDSEAEKLYRDEFSKPYHAIEKSARRRLMALDSAEDLKDLRAIPGNHLEKLSGDREGQYSIRINAQYRICFTWAQDGPADVEFVDYH